MPNRPTNCSPLPTESSPTPGVDVYATFELSNVAAVDLGVERAKTLGAEMIKPQYRTYYDSYQAVPCRSGRQRLQTQPRIGPLTALAFAAENVSISASQDSLRVSGKNDAAIELRASRVMSSRERSSACWTATKLSAM